VKATPTSLSASRLEGNWARRVFSLELEADCIATPCASPEAIGSVKATPTSLSASRLEGNWASRVVSLEPMMLGSLQVPSSYSAMWLHVSRCGLNPRAWQGIRVPRPFKVPAPYGESLGGSHCEAFCWEQDIRFPWVTAPPVAYSGDMTACCPGAGA
jgi:hypothetical protein